MPHMNEMNEAFVILLVLCEDKCLFKSAFDTLQTLKDCIYDDYLWSG